MQTSQKNKPMRYAPGINVEIRDEAWRVLRVDPIGQVHDALTVIGLSELVRDHEAIFSTEHDKVRVLDPREALGRLGLRDEHQAPPLRSRARQRRQPVIAPDLPRSREPFGKSHLSFRSKSGPATRPR